MKKRIIASVVLLIILVLIVPVTAFAEEEPQPIKSGWQKNGEQWCYVKSNGDFATGWSKIGDRWYYFTDSGKMVHGWNKVGDRWYYFGWPNDPDSGAMRHGWIKLDDRWYYLGWPDDLESGAMRHGWILLDDGWYYLGWPDDLDSGAMRRGWIELNEKWYYLGYPNRPNTGVMRTGLVNTNPDTSGTPKYYYCTASGAWSETYTGPALDDVIGKYYHVLNGALPKNESGSFRNNNINSYSYENEKITGVVSVGDKHLYLESSVPVGNKAISAGGEFYRSGENGDLTTGWFTDGGKQRYYDEETFKAVRDMTIDKLYINANAEVTEAARLASKVLDEIGWDLQAAYEWCREKPYATEYGNIVPRGTTKLAEEFFKNGEGNCYKYSAAFWYLAKTLEYPNIIHVHGSVNDGAVHGWCEVEEDGVIYVFDPTGDRRYKDGRGFHTTKEGNKAYKYLPGYKEIPLDS